MAFVYVQGILAIKEEVRVIRSKKILSASKGKLCSTQLEFTTLLKIILLKLICQYLEYTTEQLSHKFELSYKILKLKLHYTR